MEKVITIDGREMRIQANALLPRKYRHTFGRDLISDMRGLEKLIKAGKEDEIDMEIFENLTWLMLKAGGEDVGEDPEEWLATISDTFGLYQALPDVVEVWLKNNQTTATPKKK